MTKEISDEIYKMDPVAIEVMNIESKIRSSHQLRLVNRFGGLILSCYSAISGSIAADLLITKSPSPETAFMIGSALVVGVAGAYNYVESSHNSRTETTLEAVLTQHYLDQAKNQPTTQDVG